MKNAKKALVILLALSMLALLCACGGAGAADEGGDALKGTWEGMNNDEVSATWTFDGKGGCKMENGFGYSDDGTYKIDGSTVTIKLSGWEADVAHSFAIDGSKLTITANDEYHPNYELTKK